MTRVGAVVGGNAAITFKTSMHVLRHYATHLIVMTRPWIVSTRLKNLAMEIRTNSKNTQQITGPHTSPQTHDTRKNTHA